MRFILMTILLGWISLWTYYYVCWHQGHCGEGSASADPSLRVATFSNLIIRGEDLDVQANQNIKFARSQSIPIIPEQAGEALNTAKDYFTAHDDEALIITGFYDETETNASLLTNLGLARAEAFKVWLDDFGFNRKQIFVKAQESIDLSFQKDTLVDGLSFEVVDDFPEEDDLDEDELQALEEELKASSQNLYFETGETSIQVDDEIREYIQNLKYYLALQEDASITVIGHTDNVGDAKRNLEYGQERAVFTSNILRRAGIAAEQISTDSKGESQPIASNDTQEGRSQNRRVEIKLN